RRTARVPRFPYTTLFRSRRWRVAHGEQFHGVGRDVRQADDVAGPGVVLAGLRQGGRGRVEVEGEAVRQKQQAEKVASGHRPLWRSEEHTSELQSRENLVC